MRVLSCCLHMSYWDVFLTTFSHVTNSCYLHEKLTLVCFQQIFSCQSYRGVLPKLSGPGAYIIMLFTQKVIKVCFQQLFLTGQNYRGVCI